MRPVFPPTWYVGRGSNGVFESSLRDNVYLLSTFLDYLPSEVEFMSETTQPDPHLIFITDSKI